MNVLSSVITYVRRIVKTPSNASLSDDLIIDYVNRFWLMDVDARIQLFDLKTKYQFQTVPGFDRYNMPLYNLQIEGSTNPQTINFYPVYQGFMSPAYVNGIQVPFMTSRQEFFNLWPNIVQQSVQVATGNGSAGPYTFQLPFSPYNSTPINPPTQYILRGHVDMSGIIATGVNPIQDPPIGTTINTLIPSTSIYPAVYITAINTDGSSIIVQDSGQFLTNNLNLGMFMQPGGAPFGYSALPGGYSTTQNVINYFTGQVFNLTFPASVPAGATINAQSNFFQCGLPRSMLFENNTITLRSPPDKQYLVEIDAYLSPAAFLNSSQAIEFAYMSEYIARGAARKILSDTGDVEQLQLYEPFFKEQEMLVWKRSQRQFTATRTQSLYSQGNNLGQSGFNNNGGSSI